VAPSIVVKPEGELDAHTFERFRAELLAAGEGDVVVDLRDATFIDSLALGAIVQASKRASARGDTLTVVATDPHIRKVIEVTGLGQVLRLTQSIPESSV
jgi:anti-sigma B factor antagonist